MILYKLIGYDQTTGIYTDPGTGLPANLPLPEFTISDTTPDNYSEFDAPEYWALYGINLLGSVVGLKDYLALRYQIYTRLEVICGSDYSSYDSLSALQQSIALIWSNVRIVEGQGLTFYITKCTSQDIAVANIVNYLNNSKSARRQRYFNALSIYAYKYLGKLQGIKAEDYARHDFLDTAYMERGVLYISTDGIPGLGDWTLGQDIYTTTGLKPRIIGGEFTLSGGISADTFCNYIIGIIDTGIY